MAINNVMARTAWLLMHDEEFLRQNNAVSPNVFPKGTLRYLVALSLDTWRLSRTLLTLPALELTAAADARGLKRNASSKAQVVAMYDDLTVSYAMTTKEVNSIRPLARQWLEKRTVEAAAEFGLRKAQAGLTIDALSILGTAKLKDEDEESFTELTATSPDFLLNMRKRAPGAFPMGIPDLDDAWEGGYRPGELGMVVASTGIGKSMVLCKMAAEAWWLRAHILYYTFELTEEQIRDRVSLAILEKGKASVTNTWENEVAFAAKQRRKKVPTGRFEVRMHDMTWPAFANDLEEYKREWNGYPDLILLDSADDVAPLQKRDAAHHELAEAFVWLRAQTTQKQLRVWTSGQLSKGAVEKAKNISLKEIGGAFAKAQKAHYVLGFAQSAQQIAVAQSAGTNPQMDLFVLKDSLHGTKNSHLELDPTFGNGYNGYPGYTVSRTWHLPVTPTTSTT